MITQHQVWLSRELLKFTLLVAMLWQTNDGLACTLHLWGPPIIGWGGKYLRPWGSMALLPHTTEGGGGGNKPFMEGLWAPSHFLSY